MLGSLLLNLLSGGISFNPTLVRFEPQTGRLNAERKITNWMHKDIHCFNKTPQVPLYPLEISQQSTPDSRKRGRRSTDKHNSMFCKRLH